MTTDKAEQIARRLAEVATPGIVAHPEANRRGVERAQEVRASRVKQAAARLLDAGLRDLLTTVDHFCYSFPRDQENDLWVGSAMIHAMHNALEKLTGKESSNAP